MDRLIELTRLLNGEKTWVAVGHVVSFRASSYGVTLDSGLTEMRVGTEVTLTIGGLIVVEKVDQVSRLYVGLPE